MLIKYQFQNKRTIWHKKKSFKYIIGYNDNSVIRPLIVKLPQMTGHIKCFDSTKTMSFKIAIKTYLKSKIKYGGKLAV